jgi:iron complex outermembrane receptor protein
LLALLAVSPAFCSEANQDLTNLSLQELLDTRISTASRFPQELRNTPAAAFVITSEDIRRSGITSVPELLRSVPGLQVAQINSSTWAISARGFNGRFANKLLVLIDGRTVYTPIFSGTFWDDQDLILEDIESIEIIRGPGASIWGANAVNGVINIITKSAKNTHGSLVSTTTGSDDRGIVAMRYGSQINQNLDGRIYAKYITRAERNLATGAGGRDEWNQIRGGGRFDWTPTQADRVTFQTEVFSSLTGETAVIPSLNFPYLMPFQARNNKGGGFLRLNWERELPNGGALALRAYFDHMQHNYWAARIGITTYNLEIQNRLALGNGGQFSWGLDYRLTSDSIRTNSILQFNPADRSYYRAGAFAQYELSIPDYNLTLLAGSKIEHNSFTGFNVQPTGRFIWHPSTRASIWGAISRAVRTPSRAEADVALDVGVVPPFSSENPSPFPTLLRVFGNNSLINESVLAYELGYRVEPSSNLHFDITAFFNNYDHLGEAMPAALPIFVQNSAQPYLVSPLTLTQSMKGQTFGLEFAADWLVSERFRLRGSYSAYGSKLYPLSPIMGASNDTSYPTHQFSAGAIANLLDNLEFNATLRSVSRLRLNNINSYVTADLRLGWKVTPQFEVSLSGRNLFHSGRTEFVSEYLGTQSTEVPRSVFLQLVWRGS